MIKVYRVIGGVENSASVSFPMNEIRWSYHTATRLGKHLADIWQIQVAKINDGDGKYPITHFTGSNLGPYIVVNPQVLNIPAVAEVLRDEGELLPAPTGEQTSYVFTPLRYIDALDEQRTEFNILDLQEGIKRARSPVFRANSLQGVSFFRIFESWVDIFLAEPDTGGFKALYDSLGLAGLVFIEMPVTQD